MHFSRRQFLICLFIIGLFSLVSIKWFHGGELLGVGDNSISSHLPKTLESFDSGWRSEENTGEKEYRMPFQLPFRLFTFFDNVLGLSLSTSVHIRIYLSLFLPALFMLLFIDRFYKSHLHYLFKLSGALFYIFNPYTMLQPLGTVLTKFPVYLTIPLICYFLLRIFESKSTSKKIWYSIYLSLSTSLSAGSFRNIAETAPLFIVSTVFLLFLFFTHKDKLKNFLVLIFALFSAFFINFWWLYSSFYSQFLARNDFAGTVSGFDAGATFFFDAFRLFGFWALPSYFKRVLYFPFGELFYKFWPAAFTYSIPFLVFLPLAYVLKPKSKKNSEFNLLLKFMLLFALIGIFFVKGRNGIGGEWYQHLYANYPLFRVFREPFSKFSLINVFVFSSLIAAGLQVGYNFLREKIKIPVAAVFTGFLVLMATLSFPMFNGQIINEYTYGPIKQSSIIVPEYWKELGKFSENSPLVGRTLTLPKNGYYAKSFIWESGFSGQPFMFYLNGDPLWNKESGVISGGNILVSDLYKTIEEYATTRNPTLLYKFSNYAKILNIKYLLQMNDFDWMTTAGYENWSRDTLEIFYSALEGQGFLEDKLLFGSLSEEYLMTIPYISGGPNMHRYEGEDPFTEELLEAFGNHPGVEFYYLSPKLHMPRIYVPTTSISYKDLDDLMTILKSPYLLFENPVFVSEESNLDANSLVFEKTDLVFEKITDGRYFVDLSNVKSDEVFVVFSESYDPDWYLVSSCKIFCGEKVLADHYKVNGFANAWRFNKNDVDGNKILIVHGADIRLLQGGVITVGYLGFLSLVLFAVYSKEGNKK